MKIEVLLRDMEKVYGLGVWPGSRSQFARWLGKRACHQEEKKLHGEETIRQTALGCLGMHRTHFFRDPGQLRSLLSALTALKPVRPLRLWSAGTSASMEAYTLAMLLFEADLPFSLDATDLRSEAICFAQLGLYPNSELKNVPSSYRKRYFRNISTKGRSLWWETKPKLRDAVCFSVRNLLEEPPSAERFQFDAILCRNVLYYLAPWARKSAESRLVEALVPGGMLLVSKADGFTPRKSSRLTEIHPRIFRKCGGA